MALDKVIYVDVETVITAENLNDIQDAIIELEQGGTITVDSALSSTSENPVQNKVINQALGAKAPLASPTFTGTPKAPTAASGTNTTQLATTAFVQQAVGGISVPTKTSDLTNDSGFVNASGAAAAAPVQSVNGQTGAVTVPSLPTGGTAGQILKLIPGFPIGTDPLPAWSDPENQTIILDFTLDATDLVTSGPIWNDIDAALSGTNAVVAHITKNDGRELFAPLVFYDDTPGAWTARFSATNGYDGLVYSIVSGEGVANTWVYSEWDINADLTDLYDSKLDNNLGSSEAGKFLVVGSNGAITAQTQHEEVTVSTAGAVTQALDAGKLYHFTGALTALTITLNAAPAGQLAQYHFDFNCGSTAPTVTLPNTVTMPDSNSFETNKHYEVDILNNYGVVMAWATS